MHLPALAKISLLPPACYITIVTIISHPPTYSVTRTPFLFDRPLPFATLPLVLLTLLYIRLVFHIYYLRYSQHFRTHFITISNIVLYSLTRRTPRCNDHRITCFCTLVLHVLRRTVMPVTWVVNVCTIEKPRHYLLTVPTCEAAY